jgi:hypothetical protein
VQQWRRTDQPEAVAGHAWGSGPRAGHQRDDQDRKVSAGGHKEMSSIWAD